MRFRTILSSALVVALVVAGAGSLRAQESPARRLSSIVGVAVEEYSKGIDAKGRLISQQEYQETVGFLTDAQDVATRLRGDSVMTVRAVLDTLVAAVRAKVTPQELNLIHARFAAALGGEGALELPTHVLSLADGRSIFEKNCALCHGERGLGDGPAAREIHPAPPAIGSADSMTETSPALMYRVISVGVPRTQMPAWGAALTAQQRWEVVSYVQTLHSTPAERAEGEGLFLQRCATCHGNAGLLDGAATHALVPLPPEIASFAWQAERSDAQIAAAIRNGIPGSTMPPARDLADSDVAKLVAYVRSLPARRGVIPATASADTSADAAAKKVLGLLDQSLAAAQTGRMSDAGDRAFDSYIAFEPLETVARAKSPGLVAAMEQRFADFKGAIRTNDLRSAQRSRDAIEASLPAVVGLTHTSNGGWSAFFQSFLIILREGFEAILVIGAVVAFLIKTGNRERLRSIWLGAALGVVASLLTAVVLQTVLRAVPASQDLLEGITMLIAVAVLFSVSYWLISKVEAAHWQQFIREKVTTALQHGGGRALAFVAFLAVYREGAETALFFQALFGEGAHMIVPLSLGIVTGGVALAIIFILFYRYGVRIPLRPFFAVTSVLLYYMAFVFMGTGFRELQEGNFVPITPIPGLPTVEALGFYPTWQTVLAQFVLLALFVFAVAKTFWPKRSVTLPTIPPPPAPADVAAELSELRRRVEALER
ncbi:MAG: FTR1 family protein, partial [Gemmatimonadaceae bacterium]